MKKILNFLKTEFLFNGHLQSLSAAAIVFASSYINFSERRIPVFLVLSSYLTFQIIYWFDRLRGLKTDYDENEIRSKHITNFSGYLPYLIIFYVILDTFIILVRSNTTFLVVSCFVVILGILYPIYFKGLTKKIIAFKNIYVASFFTFLTLYPFIYRDSYYFDTKKLIPLLLLVYVASLLGQFFLDLKDIESDRKNGLKTVPAMLGAKTVVNLYIVGIITYLIVFLLVAVALGNIGFLIIVIISFLTDLITYYLFDKNKIASFLVSAGKYVSWSLLIFALEFI